MFKNFQPKFPDSGEFFLDSGDISRIRRYFPDSGLKFPDFDFKFSDFGNKFSYFGDLSSRFSDISSKSNEISSNQVRFLPDLAKSPWLFRSFLAGISDLDSDRPPETNWMSEPPDPISFSVGGGLMADFTRSGRVGDGLSTNLTRPTHGQPYSWPIRTTPLGRLSP